jgi:hypothetical protein
MGAMLSAGLGFIDGFKMASGFGVVSLILIVLVIFIRVSPLGQSKTAEAGAS